MQHLTPKIIGVTGGSASGKSSFCLRLHELVGSERSCILAQDHYYHDTENLGAANFDHPSSIDFDLLYHHIRMLDQGIAPRIPTYCFKESRRLARSKILAPRPIVILDGTLILTHHNIRERLDYCVFLDVEEKVRYERRLKRDIRERARTEESVREKFYTQVQPMHEIYVEPYKVHANLVVKNDESFEIALWQVARLALELPRLGTPHLYQLPTIESGSTGRVC